MSGQIIGVAVEDSHISAGIVDLGSRKVVQHSLQRRRIDPDAPAHEIISAWSKVISSVKAASSAAVNRVGLGIPGLCDYDTGYFLMNEKGRYHSLYKSNLKALLSAELDISPVDILLVNDAACFLQGEVFGGSGRGFGESLGVTLGAGLGTAKYIDGKVVDCDLHSMSLFEGEAEDYISIRWLLKRYKEISGSSVQTLAELKQRAADDHQLQLVFDEFAENLSQFLRIFIRQNNPQVVIIGGYMETCNRYFFDRLLVKMTDLGIRIPILRAVLGEQASVIGAASAWYQTTLIHER